MQISRKRNLILVEGTLQNRSYNDKNGNEQRITDISVQYIEYLGSKREKIPKKDIQNLILMIL